MAKLLGILGDVGYPLPDDARILDLGCGNGDSVQALRERGHEAFGCDFQFKEGPHRERLERQRLICKIEAEPYRLPFRRQLFDVVFSQQVLEHVQDYDGTLAEIRRVLQTTGVSLHIFPSRLRPIESHVHIPFASVFQHYGYLLLWAYLGVRKSSQRGFSPQEVARQNAAYLAANTNYLPRREIVRFVRHHFDEYQFCERTALRYSRLAPLYPVLRFVPGIGRILSTFQTRVLLLVR